MMKVIGLLEDILDPVRSSLALSSMVKPLASGFEEYDLPG